MSRLNALIVHAKPADLDTIEQLLKVLDQRSGPEDVEAETQPRPIPVYNTEATKMAEIVQQVYSDRMANGNGGDVAPGDDADDSRRPEHRTAGSEDVGRCRQ